MYGSARRSVLKQLDRIHHQGLRIALGAFRTSPAQSLYMEAHEPSLTARRLKLSLNYVIKLKSLTENPAHSCVFEPENTKLFEESESKVPPLGIRILPHLEKCKLNLNLLPRWTSSLGNFQFLQSVLTYPISKDTTNPEIYKQFYLQLFSEYPLSDFFSSTDGSKTEEGVAAAAVSTKRINKPFTCRLPDDSSIYTAELRAILLALKHVYCSKGKSWNEFPENKLHKIFLMLKELKCIVFGQIEKKRL